MIIRLSGADFSANNIGQIQLSQEVTKETKELLANYSRVLTKKQQLAVQDFVNGLQTEGIWACIENLYIPALAGDVSESLYDIKGKVIDAVPTENYYLLEKHGLRTNYYSENTTIPTNSRAIIKMNASYMNLHYMAYIADDIWGDSDHYSDEVFMTTYNSSVYKGLRLAEGSDGNWQLSINGNPARFALSLGRSNDGNTVSGFVGVSCGGDGLATGVLNNSNAGQLSVYETSDTTITDADTYIGCSVQGYARCSTPMRILSTGTAMDVDMMLKYAKLCDTLIASIC